MHKRLGANARTVTTRLLNIHSVLLEKGAYSKTPKRGIYTLQREYNITKYM